MGSRWLESAMRQRPSPVFQLSRFWNRKNQGRSLIDWKPEKYDVLLHFQFGRTCICIRWSVSPYHPPSEEVPLVNNYTINSPRVKSDLQKMIKDLGDSVHSIEVCFSSIAGCFRKAQRQGTGGSWRDMLTTGRSIPSRIFYIWTRLR